MRLEAPNIGAKLAREVKVTDMDNLQDVIYLAKGARVMCTWIGWKKAGVVNGAQGNRLRYKLRGRSRPALHAYCHPCAIQDSQ